MIDNDEDYKLHAVGAVLDYSFNWGTASENHVPWLEEGDTLINSTWEVTPIGLSLTLPAMLPGGITVVFCGGGRNGVDYHLKNTVTTAQGRTDSRTMVLQCRVR